MLEIHGAHIHIVYQENAEIYVPKATHSCIISEFDSKVSQYIPTNISSLPLNGIEHNHNGNKVQELFCYHFYCTSLFWFVKSLSFCLVTYLRVERSNIMLLDNLFWFFCLLLLLLLLFFYFFIFLLLLLFYFYFSFFCDDKMNCLIHSSARWKMPKYRTPQKYKQLFSIQINTK